MYNQLEISEKTVEFVHNEEKKLEKEFKKIDEICEQNSLRVLSAFNKFEIAE